MRRWVVLVLLLIVGTAFLGCATTRLQSELVSNDEYFRVAHREIQNAKESIYLIAYLFLLYDYEDAYSNRILKDLIEAHNRGVDVHVILEYPKPEYMKEEGLENQKAYERMRGVGIDVRFDSAERTTHSKILIIDGETIIAGSHNYTFDGLKYNNEISLLLKEREKAERLIRYFRQIQ